MRNADANGNVPDELSEQTAKKLVDMIADVEREEAAELDHKAPAPSESGHDVPQQP